MKCKRTLGNAKTQEDFFGKEEYNGGKFYANLTHYTRFEAKKLIVDTS